jgi:hypothetical protein
MLDRPNSGQLLYAGWSAMVVGQSPTGKSRGEGLVQWSSKGEFLNIQWSGPNIARSDVPESALSHRDGPTTATQP